MSELTLVLGRIVGRGKMMELLSLLGSHLSSFTRTEFPSPILQTIPFRITSLAPRMLFQAYEPAMESFASKIEQFGKNLALKTRKQSESGY